jgi:integrase
MTDRLSPIYAYTRQRFRVRFERYQAAHPDEGLTAQVANWLATIPIPTRRNARIHIQALLTGQPVEWKSVPPAGYKRDGDKLEGSVLDETEFPQLVGACRTARERALVYVLFTLRRVEVPRLRWESIDWRSGRVRIHGKGNKHGWTLLSRDALAALHVYDAEQGHPTTGLIFTNRHYPGRAVTPPAIGKEFDGLVRRAGLKKTWRNCHALRRTMASRFLEVNPGDVGSLQVIMRHASIATTALYNYPRPASLAPRLNNAIASLHGPVPPARPEPPPPSPLVQLAPLDTPRPPLTPTRPPESEPPPRTSGTPWLITSSSTAPPILEPPSPASKAGGSYLVRGRPQL